MVNKLKNLVSNVLNISNTNVKMRTNSHTTLGVLFKEQYHYHDTTLTPAGASGISTNTWQAFLKKRNYPQVFLLFFIFSIFLSVALTDYFALPVLSSKLCTVSELEVLTSHIDDLQKSTESALKQSERLSVDVLSVKDSIADLQKILELAVKKNERFSVDVLSVKDSITDLQKSTELALKNNANFTADVLSVKESITDLQKSTELISKKNNLIESSITSISNILKSQEWLDFFDILRGRRPPRF